MFVVDEIEAGAGGYARAAPAHLTWIDLWLTDQLSPDLFRSLQVTGGGGAKGVARL